MEDRLSLAGIKFANTRRVLEDIGILNPTYDDCAIVQHICRQVSKRAARLAGAGKIDTHFVFFCGRKKRMDWSPLGLSVLINRIGKTNVTVGVDGSLYRYHPRFKRNMERCMETLVNRTIKVRDKNSPCDDLLLRLLLFRVVQVGVVGWWWVISWVSHQHALKGVSGSGKGAAMVACVAERNLSIGQLCWSRETNTNRWTR